MLSPAARYQHRLCFDPYRGVTILFGGAPGVSSDVWEWDGANWSLRVTTAQPPARRDFAMAFDRDRGRVVVFGGNSGGTQPLGDLWELVDLAATAATYGTSCSGTPLAATPTAGSRPVLGTAQQTDIQGATNGVAFVALGLSRTSLGGLPLPMSLAAVGMPGCDLLQDLVVFGIVATPTGPSSARFALTLPADLSIVGQHVYEQAWTPWPGANSAGLVTSNGVDLWIGIH